jgi:hypothetical protein
MRTAITETWQQAGDSAARSVMRMNDGRAAAAAQHQVGRRVAHGVFAMWLNVDPH